MNTITSEKELGRALKSNQDTIEIKGDLSKKVLKIKATGTVAWAIAIGAIGIAVASILAAPATAGTSASVAYLSGTAAVSTIGFSATTTAITIAVAAGGVGSLNSLRSYKVVHKTSDKIILKKN